MTNAVALRPASALMQSSVARRLDHVPESWGYGSRDTLRSEPPARDELLAFRPQLIAALEPAGMKAGLQAALMLIESFPQADRTGTLYPEALGAKLAECPNDLLMGVISALLDSMTHRPAVKEVHEAVQKATAPRKLLLMRCDAALRWHGHQAVALLRSGEAMVSAEQVAGVIPSLRAPRPYQTSAQAEEPTAAPRAIIPRYLSNDELFRIRSAAKKPSAAE